jgi:hypothetical protein
MVPGFRSLPGGQCTAGSDFEVGYIDPEEGEVRRLLADTFGAPFERLAPVRSFPSYKGQRNYPGLAR